MKRLTFITTLQMYWGGSEELWARSALLAIQRGYTVQVVVYKQLGGKLHPTLEVLKTKVDSFIEMDNDLFFLTKRSKYAYSIKNKIAPFGFSKIEKFTPDCIYINQSHSYSAAFHPLLFPFLCNTKIPYFLISQFNTEHECLSYADIEKARVVFKKSAKNFFVSNRNRIVVERQIAENINDVVIIDNPINIHDKNYLAYPVNETIQFASVARLDVNYKGQDVLFQIFSSVEWIAKKWHLNIYGIGKDALYLNDLMHFYKLTNRITFHGQVEDIRNVWRTNHVLLMPSIAEGKPLALEEAMVCGRIGIVSDVAGNSELIEDCMDGYLASSYLPKPFEEVLLKAWSQRNQWEGMGRIAHEKMNNILDFEPEATLLSYIR